MHDAKVHVFSESVLCLGKGEMNDPVVKFTKRWTEFFEHCRESARRIDREKIKFVFHVHLGKKTNELKREIDEWIRQGEYGQFFTSENWFSSSLIHGNDERNSDFFKGAKRKSGHSMYISPGSEKTWNPEKYPDDKKMG